MHKQRQESTPGFLFYDYETFGINPAYDRIAQFGAIRTDQNLEFLDEPEVFYCQPTKDFLPHPDACLLTGITPQVAQAEGVKEWEFAQRIYDLMSVPDTCTLGYNNFRFDDEFTRYLFYRNALDPYAREYKDGNSRFDLIDLVRLTYALRPQGINWPMHDESVPSFKLEDLTQANGIEHGQAHDALADVYATIEIAKLIRKAQPRLWEWALQLRDKYHTQDLINQGKPLVHSSARIPSALGCATLVLPLATHPTIRNQHVVFDLRHSPKLFLELAHDELKDYLYTPKDDLPAGTERLPIKTIKLNRAPMLAPMSTLKGVDHHRIDLNVDQCLVHMEELKACQDLAERIVALFDTEPWPASDDPEAALYEGFISYEDRHTLNRFHTTPAAEWPDLERRLADARLPELMFRARARNFPETLSTDELQRWEQHCYQRLCANSNEHYFNIEQYEERIKDLNSKNTKPELIDALKAWPLELRLNYLAKEYGT